MIGQFLSEKYSLILKIIHRILVSLKNNVSASFDKTGSLIKIVFKI